MKISYDEYWELSDLLLYLCRNLDDALYSSGGWQGWSTGGMRCMTNDILQQILDKLDIEVGDNHE